MYSIFAICCLTHTLAVSYVPIPKTRVYSTVIVLEMTIWPTRGWTFRRQWSGRLEDKNESLRQSEYHQNCAQPQYSLAGSPVSSWKEELRRQIMPTCVTSLKTPVIGGRRKGSYPTCQTSS